MLIEKKPTTGEVVTIRLISGEEIIGKLAHSTDTTVTKLSQPIQIALQMLPSNQAQIAFAPFMASTDEESSISFPNSALVVTPTKTRDDVKKQYIKATSSIEIVPEGLLSL
jgi:hypothetical protein